MTDHQSCSAESEEATFHCDHDQDGKIIGDDDDGYHFSCSKCGAITDHQPGLTQAPAETGDHRNQADRLLNAAMDHIAATLEQPVDPRAWIRLLVYCPKDILADFYEARMARRIDEIREGEA